MNICVIVCIMMFMVMMPNPGLNTSYFIQVWDLELRRMAYSLQWDANITAFSIIQGTYFMYVI